MRFTLLVLTSPEGGSSARHALAFARAATHAGHELACVFFYDEGVLTAAGGTPGGGEMDLREGWASIATSNAVPLLLCTASVARFGVEGAASTEAGYFSIGSLGDLVAAQASSDRLLTFRG